MTTSDPRLDCGGPLTQVSVWGPPRRDLGTFCEACIPEPGSSVLPPEHRATVAAHLDAVFADLLTEIPPPAPPKPFDLADLTRLAAEVATMQPRLDRAIIAPDVKDWLLANVAIAGRTTA